MHGVCVIDAWVRGRTGGSAVVSDEYDGSREHKGRDGAGYVQ